MSQPWKATKIRIMTEIYISRNRFIRATISCRFMLVGNLNLNASRKKNPAELKITVTAIKAAKKIRAQSRRFKNAREATKAARESTNDTAEKAWI